MMVQKMKQIIAQLMMGPMLGEMMKSMMVQKMKQIMAHGSASQIQPCGRAIYERYFIEEVNNTSTLLERKCQESHQGVLLAASAEKTVLKKLMNDNVKVFVNSTGS